MASVRVSGKSTVFLGLEQATAPKPSGGVFVKCRGEDAGSPCACAGTAGLLFSHTLRDFLKSFPGNLAIAGDSCYNNSI